MTLVPIFSANACVKSLRSTVGYLKVNTLNFLINNLYDNSNEQSSKIQGKVQIYTCNNCSKALLPACKKFKDQVEKKYPAEQGIFQTIFHFMRH
jgi:hypothetical protein